MVSLSFRGVILSASIATLAIVIQTAPVPTPPPRPHTSPPPSHDLDPCGVLAASVYPNITYEKVSDCYKSIPFDKEIGASTIETVYTLFNDFYVFRDSALAPTLTAPFKSAPFDILEKIKAIGQTNYTVDHEFHNDLQVALYGLYDAHANYIAFCYMSYTFSQRMVLYAPVVNGQQEIRVFQDDGNRNYEDCIVRTINGQNALSYLNEWSDKYVFSSKDPGVRLNVALATQSYIVKDASFAMIPGEFALRRRLPEGAYVDYELQCNSSFSLIQVRDRWNILPTTRKQFKDAASFVENLCLAPPAESVAASSNVELMSVYHPEVPREVRHIRPKIHDVIPATAAAAAPPLVPPPRPVLAGATMIGNGNGTVVYHLNDRPQVGVLVVHTHGVGVEDGEMDSIATNLVELSKRGVTNLIIDLQGNGGGYVVFASKLVQMFFPNKDILDTSLPSNLRVTDSIEQLSRQGFNQSWAGLWSSLSLYDYTNKSIYADDDLFTNPISTTRYGRTANFSETTTYAPSLLRLSPTLLNLPWTNQPDRIRILTDGRCGSSCSQSSFYFSKFKKVQTYAIGGFPGVPLSMSSFPGGVVTKLNDLCDVYDGSNTRSPVKRLPYDGIARFTSLEVFAPGSDLALDFDGAQYAAEHRLDFTPQNARNRDVMWNEVAAHAWK